MWWYYILAYDVQCAQYSPNTDRTQSKGYAPGLTNIVGIVASNFHTTQTADT